MKIFVGMIFLLSFSMAQTKQLDLGLDNPNVEKDLDQLLALIMNYDELKSEDDDYELFTIHNGDYSVSDYDVDTFDLQSVIAEMKSKNDQESDCQFEVKKEKNVSEIKDIEESYTGDKVLTQLEATKMIKAIVSRRWDGASGDSEYCSYNTFSIYLKNGKVIVIHYDHTT